MTLYDYKMFKEIYPQLETYHKYLNSDKVIYVFQKKMHYSFIKFFRRLVDLRLNNSGINKIEEYINKLLNSERFSYKEWILDKAHKIKESYLLEK
jgi:hypothetical protein